MFVFVVMFWIQSLVGSVANQFLGPILQLVIYFIICHCQQLLTICPSPPSAPAHCYSICSTVFILVLTSIMSPSTGSGILVYLATMYSLNSPLYTSCKILFTKYLLFPLHKSYVSRPMGFSLPSI